ncbi:MAG: hypothetical protein V1778_00205 [bacterium]
MRLFPLGTTTMKTLFWSGCTGFLLASFGILFASKAGVPAAINSFWIVLLGFCCLLGIALLNWSIVFARQPVFPPFARHVPKKYYGVAFLLLALFGVGLLL